MSDNVSLRTSNIARDKDIKGLIHIENTTIINMYTELPNTLSKKW